MERALPTGGDNRKRCAVIADVIATDYYFPLWLNYYGRAVGHENIYLFSYGSADQLEKFGVGRVTKVTGEYNNITRAQFFPEITKILLSSYDVVIRVDIDEFLIPSLKYFTDLDDFIQRLDRPYITALGLDVLEMPRDTKLNYRDSTLLSQRKIAVKSAAYSKTCIVTQQIRWGYGFHHANVPPSFADLYLFHFKFADVEARLQWFDKMYQQCVGNEAHQVHFLKAKAQLTQTRDFFYTMPLDPRQGMMEDQKYQLKILNSVTPPEEHGGLYTYLDGTDTSLITVDSDYCEVV